MSKFTALIVEDSTNYQEIYQRAIERQGGEAIIASSYVEATHAIQRRLFPVAIIDLSLSPEDETNRDGLKVLDFIHQIGDATNAILITGFGDVELGFEAVEKYKFFAAFGKGVPLAKIEDKVAEAHKKFKEKKGTDKGNYTGLIKGPIGPLWEWEDHLIRAFAPTGGADGLYRFLEALLRDVVPLLRHVELQGCRIDNSKEVAAGLFWSRSFGQGVFVAFGKENGLAKFQGKADQKSLAELFINTQPLSLGRLVKKVDAHGLHGLVRTLDEADFKLFDSTR